MAASTSLSCTLELQTGADPRLTMAALWQGSLDRQMRLGAHTIARAFTLPAGPATLELHVAGRLVKARAWGPGATEALTRVPGLVGELDDATQLQPRHAVVAGLIHRLPGLRMTRGIPVLEALLPAIIGQKVTRHEAQRSLAALVDRYGTPAPGPLGLRLAPDAASLARLPYWAFHPCGIERRRADAIRIAARSASQLERALAAPAGQGWAALTSLPGIGGWTAAETMRVVNGDPDAVSVGDYNLPVLVCSAFGHADADDARMLELLEPYRGQRARVVLLIENGGFRLARHGPRFAARSIAAI